MFDNKRIETRKIKDNLSKADQLFDEMLEVDATGKLPGNLRPVANQLDILLRLPTKESE